MRFEIEFLLLEFKNLGLDPVKLPSDNPNIQMIRIEIFKGLPCFLQITEPACNLFNFTSSTSIPVTIGGRLADLERIMSQLDDLIAPVRLFGFSSEIGISLHGSWSTVEGLLHLCLESVLVHRRLAEFVLYPLLEFTKDQATALETLARIIEGLAQSTPVNAVENLELQDNLTESVR